MVALLPVLKRHLESRFNSRSTIIGIKHPGQSGGSEFDQPPCQPNCRNVAHSQKSCMGDGIDLLFESFIQLGYTVAMNIAPEGGSAIEIIPAVEIAQETAMGGGDDQGALAGVVFHRREWVPDMLAVPLLELGSVRRWCGGSDVSGNVARHDE